MICLICIWRPGPSGRSGGGPGWRWRRTASTVTPRRTATSGGEVIATESLWEGRGRRETVRIHYGPGLSLSFLAEVYVPAAPGRHPAITWNQFGAGAFDCCPYEQAVAERGYMIARFDREQVAHDERPGTRAVYDAYPGYDWGAIRAWAWAQSRLADYLLTREDADPARLCCTGFSRGGKVALAPASSTGGSASARPSAPGRGAAAASVTWGTGRASART